MTRRIAAAAAVALVALAGCAGRQPFTASDHPAASPSPATDSPAPRTPAPATTPPGTTAADVLCAQGLVQAMKLGLDHTVVNSADVTAAQQQAEFTLAMDCQAVIQAHGEHMDADVWALTAAAGYPRSRWDQ